MAINRPPLDPGCLPAPPAGLDDQASCAMLPQLRMAYYTLLSGQQTAQVRDADRWQTFQPGNMRELRREITRLEILCQNTSFRTVQVGRSRRHCAPYGYNRYGGY